MSDATAKKKFFDLLENMEGATTETELKALIEKNLNAFGIEYFVVCPLAGLVSRDHGWMLNYDLEWRNRYFVNKYRYFDPVVTTLMEGGGGIPWKEIREKTRPRTKGWQILNEGKEFGLSDGYAFPILGPNGYFAAAAFAGPRVDDDPSVSQILRLLGVYTHARILSLANPLIEQAPNLTGREREILAWVATGRSDSEIGEILTISETTVHMHVENAKRKLGAKRRISAVIEALRHRLLRI
ncbi:MAG: LuxR family transcriptional regulator [Alphaproteobacteria bacterium]|nr:LuxR family transcriptional regulator [Alphaproteobacteria bacterium]